MSDSFINKHGTAIHLGQVWKDNDPRVPDRTMKVVGFETAAGVVRAVCTVLTGSTKGRTNRINIDRLHPTSTGYLLVADHHDDAEPVAASTPSTPASKD